MSYLSQDVIQFTRMLCSQAILICLTNVMFVNLFNIGNRK